MSFNSYDLDTKFGKAKDFINEIEKITGKKIIHTIQDAEPIGPKQDDRYNDCMRHVLGNTMSKLACDISRYTSSNGCEITFKKSADQ